MMPVYKLPSHEDSFETNILKSDICESADQILISKTQKNDGKPNNSDKFENSINAKKLKQDLNSHSSQPTYSQFFNGIISKSTQIDDMQKDDYGQINICQYNLDVNKSEVAIPSGSSGELFEKKLHNYDPNDKKLKKLPVVLMEKIDINSISGIKFDSKNQKNNCSLMKTSVSSRFNLKKGLPPSRKRKIEDCEINKCNCDCCITKHAVPDSNTLTVNIRKGKSKTKYLKNKIPVLSSLDYNNDDVFTLHMLYRVLKIGYVRNVGFVKDIIPSLKGDEKEEALQFKCKSCAMALPFHEVKYYLSEDQLSCVCPKTNHGYKIPAELSFKFIVQELNKKLSTYLLVGKEAELFFGCTVKDFWLNKTVRCSVRRAIRNVLRSYNRKILSEFCLSTKNLFGSGPKYLVNISKKVCAPTMDVFIES